MWKMQGDEAQFELVGRTRVAAIAANAQLAAPAAAASAAAADSPPAFSDIKIRVLELLRAKEDFQDFEKEVVAQGGQEMVNEVVTMTIAVVLRSEKVRWED
tara:strand:+ start:231 stop:533 length:303 start_codon:yes stop_codon:yes gene_type:complete